MGVEIIEDMVWIRYKSDDYKSNPFVGKFMTFGCGDIQSETKVLIIEAIKQGLTPLVKHTNTKSDFVNPNSRNGTDDWVICWYCDDDVNKLKILSKFLVDNNLIRKTKTGKLYNISFKYDLQTRLGEYGDSYKSKIVLGDLVNLYTGELI